MNEMFENTLRDPEDDSAEMKRILIEAGWEEVEGEVESISVGLGLFNKVKPGTVVVFSPTDNVERQLPVYPKMARNTRFMTPYVMLALETFRYGLGRSIQIAGGSIAGINEFKLKNNE